MVEASLEVRVELRIRGDRAVLADDRRELPPESVLRDDDLAVALHEWAKVAAVMTATEPSAGTQSDTVDVVSRRGHQLAGRLATHLREPVHYRNPLTDTTAVVVPSPQDVPPGLHRRTGSRRLFQRSSGEPTPWATGLTVAVFFAAIVAIALLALTTTVAREVNVWIALVAAIVFTAGLAPSLWLGRTVAVLRWVCLGAAVGLGVGWVGLLPALL